MLSRLPALPVSSDDGYVYVVERGGIYKIGFSRASVRRRARDIGGRLVLTIRTGVDPSALECAIHHRFADRRTPGPVFKREWFALDDDDIRWLHGFAAFHRLHSSTLRVG